MRKFLTDRGVESKRIFVESRIDNRIREPRLDAQLLGRPATNRMRGTRSAGRRAPGEGREPRLASLQSADGNMSDVPDVPDVSDVSVLSDVSDRAPTSGSADSPSSPYSVRKLPASSPCCCSQRTITAS